MTKDELIIGGIYRYNNGGLCRHGMCRIDRDSHGRMVARDTYWGDLGEPLDPGTEHLSVMEFLFDASAPTRNVSREEFDTYDDDVRLYIPIGGRSEQRLVYASAKPNPTKLAESIARKIQSLRGEIDYRIDEVCRLTVQLRDAQIAASLASQEPVRVEAEP